MRNRILYVLAAVAALVLVFSIGKCASKNDYEQRMAEWKTRAHVAEMANKAIRAEADSARRVAAEGQQRDSAAVASIDSLQRRLARERTAKNALMARLREDVETPDTAALRRAARQALDLAAANREEADSLDVALTGARATIQQGMGERAMLVGVIRKLEVQNDSLLVLIKTVPVHKGDRLLGILPLPSRTASFAIGAVAGVAAAVWVVK